MNHIIETIGAWGVRSTPVVGTDRMTRPRPGDLVRFPETLLRYPVRHELCRISTVDRERGRVVIVDGMGSAYLEQCGGVIISGGPFFGVSLSSLEPTYGLACSRVWNWGDNSPGGGQGVEYALDRPVFLATRHPDEDREHLEGARDCRCPLCQPGVF